MNTITLTAETRPVGKGAARALRRSGKVPCIMYGRRIDSLPFSTTEKSLMPLIHKTEALVVSISMEGKQWRCIPKEIAFHPVTDRPMHVDFQVLYDSDKVALPIPVRFVGTSKGHSRGGSINFMVRDLVVSCLPKDIPAVIEVDVSDVDIGGAIHVRDLKMKNLRFVRHKIRFSCPLPVLV